MSTKGAGSPAEINLKQIDIVNMGLAKMVRSPVLLAADIDRGGVFASLYGTLALLEPAEKALVKGTIINKFRGDVEILRPGLTMLEELTKVDVLGVVPMLPLDLEDEDSLSDRFAQGSAKGLVDIAVVRFPWISNFTDFNRLQGSESIRLRYVTHPQDMGRPDLILLPGTKSTMADLLWMRQNGLEAQIKKLADTGTPVFGICGGYQMLGQTLQDPEGVESGGTLRGMELLPGRSHRPPSPGSIGFVNVLQSKQRIMAAGVPCIAALGRKGGSGVAAAILNALLYLAGGRSEDAHRALSR
jgi:adenosylcobyric acid synthase